MALSESDMGICAARSESEIRPDLCWHGLEHYSATNSPCHFHLLLRICVGLESWIYTLRPVHSVWAVGLEFLLLHCFLRCIKSAGKFSPHSESLFPEEHLTTLKSGGCVCGTCAESLAAHSVARLLRDTDHFEHPRFARCADLQRAVCIACGVLGGGFWLSEARSVPSAAVSCLLRYLADARVFHFRFSSRFSFLVAGIQSHGACGRVVALERAFLR